MPRRLSGVPVPSGLWRAVQLLRGGSFGLLSQHTQGSSLYPFSPVCHTPVGSDRPVVHSGFVCPLARSHSLIHGRGGLASHGGEEGEPSISPRSALSGSRAARSSGGVAR